ncbi:hypothetical protein DFQ27_000827 [Actinomortierella ambigua]|uniref:Steroid 5-alpha reductase C-terminal domain-containing protein n=1 Tax=Actinomortierella ambigua TaxID=1343610 RepID=A0A9P6QF07_9FUNG|nr:hypothetical protein DFQ27_000827 [Actinomortierella ambigua]
MDGIPPVLQMLQSMSWTTFKNILINGYSELRFPDTDNSKMLVDFIWYHARADPFIFVIRASMVDKLWSIIPVFYALHFTLHHWLYFTQDNGDAMPLNYRLVIAACLITMWGARLTYNFYRKGGYGMEYEDHRWVVLQEKIPIGLWFIFNTTFICIFQNMLLAAIVVPLYVVWRANLFNSVPLNIVDAAATALFLLGFFLEVKADQQQWAFHEQKRLAAEAKKRPDELTGDVKRGFLTHGLFKYSRHPNFFGEMSMWWAIYLFSVAAAYPHLTTEVLINPSIVGVIALTLLFQVSTTMTERLTSGKYASYKLYQKTTSRLIPLPAGTSLDKLEKKNA